MFLIDIRLKKCVIKLSILITEYNLFLITIKLKKYAIELLINVLLHLLIFLIDKTNRIYSILMKILVICNKMGILSIAHSNINLDDTN